MAYHVDLTTSDVAMGGEIEKEGWREDVGGNGGGCNHNVSSMLLKC
jgi:hypothetical protein